MSIVLFIFVSVGLVCIIKGTLNLIESKKDCSHISFQKYLRTTGFESSIQVLIGIILILFGGYTIPHYIIERKIRDSLVLPELTIRNFNKDFDIHESSQFSIPVVIPESNLIFTYDATDIRKPKFTNLLLFRTRTSSSTIEFMIPRESLTINSSVGTEIIATKVSETLWYLWPFDHKYFIYELR